MVVIQCQVEDKSRLIKFIFKFNQKIITYFQKMHHSLYHTFYWHSFGGSADFASA